MSIEDRWGYPDIKPPESLARPRRVLSEKQFFHGTIHDIKGGRILPANKARKETNYGMSDPDLAYTTTDEETAWALASEMPDHRGVMPRKRVYQVLPNPRSRPGSYNEESPNFNGVEDLKEHVAKSWRVAVRHDIKPGHQGTFPEINWNEHLSDDAAGWGVDANHPSPIAEHEGHAGSTLQTALYENRMRHLSSDQFGPPAEVKGQEVLFPAPGMTTRGTMTREMRERETQRIRRLISGGG